MNYKREMFDKYSFIALKQVLATMDQPVLPARWCYLAPDIAQAAGAIAEAMLDEREKRVAKYKFDQPRREPDERTGGRE